MAKDRPNLGYAINRERQIRFTSAKQIKLFDKDSDGCPRKWAFQYRFGKKPPKTTALDTGIEGAEKLEHYLKTNELVLPPVLHPALKYFPEPQNPVTGEFDLEVEQPLGDIEKAVYCRDTLLKQQNNVAAVFHNELSTRINRFAGVSAHDIPIDGAADYRHQRGFYKNEEGVNTREHPSTRVVEIGDLKMIARIHAQRILNGPNAGNLLPGWAKTSAEVCSDVQMVIYGRHAVDRYPDLTHVRLSHIYGQKSKKGAAKRTGLISVDEVVRRFHHVEDLVGQMVQVATADRIEDVEYNTAACDSFMHVVVGPDGKPVLDAKGKPVQQKGCPHRYYCPLSAQVTVQNLLGVYKESVMSLFDTLPKDVLPAAPTEPQPVVDETAAVEAYKAQLRAQDEAREQLPKDVVMKFYGNCPACGEAVSSDNGSKLPTGVLKHIGCPMAVTPPDAPPPAPLIAAADPLPAAVIAEITDPALKATVEAHAKEHARLQAEKEAAEEALKRAAGTSVWCKDSGQPLTPTMDMALAGKFLCSCTKEFTLKSLKQEDGSFVVKRHKPVNKIEVVEAPPAPTIAEGEEDEVPSAPAIEVVEEQKENGKVHGNGKQEAMQNFMIIELLTSIDSSLKKLVERGEKL